VVIVEGGGHSDLGPFDPYVPLITGFLERHLAMAIPTPPSAGRSTGP
jgi:hypothetical protein